jgi:hypothetical protein
MKRLTFGVLAALAASMIAPWAALPVSAGQAQQFDLVSGWYRDRQVEYYDFGANTRLATGGLVQTAPIYVFIHGMNADGTPDFVEGQHNIVDVAPGDAGYSDLWQVMLVTVPGDYEPDSITSRQEIDDAGLAVTATDMYVNCPVVPAGSTLEGGTPLVQGWYKGEEVFYPDFGMNSRAAIPIYALIHGMNADGTPDFVEGQNNIIDSVPADAGYSAFWRVVMVTVTAGYVPNSIRSAEAVRNSGFAMTTTDMVVNCPVTSVAAAAQPPSQQPSPPEAPVAAPSTGTGGGPERGERATFVFVVGGIGAAVLAAGAWRLVARRR